MAATLPGVVDEEMTCSACERSDRNTSRWCRRSSSAVARCWEPAAEAAVGRDPALEVRALLRVNLWNGTYGHGEQIMDLFWFSHVGHDPTTRRSSSNISPSPASDETDKRESLTVLFRTRFRWRASPYATPSAALRDSFVPFTPIPRSPVT
jgi:hypothetical protein